MFLDLLVDLYRQLKAEPLPFPPPFKRMIAIDSDVELTTWEAQVDLLRCFAERDLEVSFSFWFFGVPKSTWRLLEENGAATPYANKAIALMKHGLLDNLHGFGGRKIDDDTVCFYDIDDIKSGYRMLSEAGVRPTVFSNHGGTDDRQNVGGEWAYYQEGDLPESDLYHLDLTIKNGIKFFWCDPDIVNARPMLAPALDAENGLFVSSMGRDGTPFIRFRRYMGKDLGRGPALANLHKQLRQVLRAEDKGYCVLYQHLGFARDENGNATEADTKNIGPETYAILDELVRYQDESDILVTTTGRLLNHAALMTARPWTVSRRRGQIEIHFDRTFDLNGVTFEVTPDMLSGWTIPVRFGKVVAFLDGENLPISEIRLGYRRLFGFPWRKLAMRKIVSDVFGEAC